MATLPTSSGSSVDTDSTVDAIISQATALVKNLNAASRRKLIDGFRDLAVSLEDTQDTVNRLLYTQYPLTALRIGCDLKLFHILQEAEKPLSVDELAAQTGVAPLLLGRLLRYMASARLIKETGKDTFAANHVTKIFTHPGFQGGVYHYHDYCGRGLQRLPDSLKEHGYKDITIATETPLLEAWDAVGISPFAHYSTKPQLFGHFQQFMVAQRMGMPTWLDVYPYKVAAASVKSPEQPFFVDIGGGFGHQTLAIREALPDLPNKFILQDLPDVLAMPPVVKHAGIENIAADFWKPQVTKGARIYYLRNIIHDFSDEKAIEILKNTKEAMGPDSVILIDEMFLPDQGVSWQATQIDITMMSNLASLERRKEEWYALIAGAGLKIREVFEYTQSLNDSIIECVPA